MGEKVTNFYRSEVDFSKHSQCQKASTNHNVSTSVIGTEDLCVRNQDADGHYRC